MLLQLISKLSGKFSLKTLIIILFILVLGGLVGYFADITIAIFLCILTFLIAILIGGAIANRRAKQLQKSLATLKELEHIVNHSPVVTFLWQAKENWPVEFVSSNVEQFGYSCDDFQSGRVLFTSIIHPDDLNRVHLEVVKYSQAGVTDFTQEYRIMTKRGEVRWIDDHTWVRRTQDGTITHYQGTVIDITERKKTEVQLEATNINLNKFKKTLDMTLDCVLMFDAHTLQIFYANQGAINQLGYSQEELLQMTVLDINPYQTEKQTRECLTPLLEGSQPSVTLETIYQHENTTLIQVETFFQYISIPPNPLLSKRENHLDKEESFFVAIVRDITERKRAETKLQQAKISAEEAQKAAEVANHAKSAFLANMSHELRTPLNGVLGYTQILNRDKTLTDKQKEGINIIHRSSEHLLTLINDILDLSKIEAGKLEINPVDFHLPDFLQNIADIMKMRAEQKSIEFVYEILYQLPIIVHTDEKRLRQVLLNLLSNAIKFTDKGSVTLKVIYYDGKIRFEVEDTGMGIPVEQLEAIFLPFQQIGDQSQQMEGTGLGLPISKQLVEMMGGQLQIESFVGTGSIFWFEIPLQEVQGAMNIKRTQQATIIGYKEVDREHLNQKREVFFTPKNSPFTLLVVDDQWQNRAFLVNLLKDLGFHLLEANNGKEALNLALEYYPDMIITDLVMPVMNGFELTQKIRETAQLKNIVVIADSANVFEHHQHKSLEVGCNEFIAKPIRTEILLDLLQKYLPLEWVYEKPKTSSLLVQEETQIPYVAPSSEQALVLFKLIMSGNIKKIIENVEQLELQDAKFSAFAQKVKKLAKGFEMSKLKKLVNLIING